MIMSMLVIDGIKYNLLVLREEKQLEEFVKKHYNEIFGKESLYFDIKPELRSQAGIGSKPDGIVVMFDKPSYFVVENEIAEHDIHGHVIKQISSFNMALKKPETKKKIAEAVFNEINNDILKKHLAKSKVEGELYKFLLDLFSQKPVIAIIINELIDELKESVRELPLESRIVEFRTFVREDAPNIHAHLFNPIAEVLPHEEGVPNMDIEQKKREMLEYAKSDELKAIITKCLNRLDQVDLQIKPVSGLGVSVLFKGKSRELKFIWIYAYQRFLRVWVYKPNGKEYICKITNEEELEDTFKNKIEPILKEYKEIA
jgi:hypothetical protein